MINGRMYEKLKDLTRKKEMVFYSDLTASLGMSFDTEADRNVFKK